MKKHPIDDLFAKKLAEHRQEPSQKAFEKFQERLQKKEEKNRFAFFYKSWPYYVAAAGIIMALSISFLTENKITNKPSIAVANKNPNVREVTINDRFSGNKTTAISTPISAKNEVEKTLKLKANNFSNNKQQTIEAINKSVEIEESIFAQNKDSLQSIELNNLPETNTLTQNIPTAVVESPKESIILVIEPQETIVNTDTTVIEIANLEQSTDESAKSFIAKLYKSLKYGEKVSLKDRRMKETLASVDKNFFREEREDLVDYVHRKLGRLQKENNLPLKFNHFTKYALIK